MGHIPADSDLADPMRMQWVLHAIGRVERISSITSPSRLSTSSPFMLLSCTHGPDVHHLDHASCSSFIESSLSLAFEGEDCIPHPPCKTLAQQGAFMIWHATRLHNPGRPSETCSAVPRA